LWKLSCVVLDNKNVAKPPLADCPPFESCKELNLYNNLIAKWSDLFAILDFFPSLLYLNVRRNIMEPRMSSVDRKVKSPVILLVISECHIDEETAKKLMQIFPRLAELYISRNGLKYFDPGDYGRNLTVLDLEGNPINDFTRLHNLASLPRLVSLNLTECGLTAIRLPDPVGFYALKTLIMRNNDVHDWESVSEIAKLPALQQLLYNGNWQVKPEFGLDVREVLIAKLPKLIDLERSEISPVERRSAEIRFLNKYSVSPVCQQHVNDIERLKRVHGEPDIVNQTMNLGLSLIELNVTLDCKSVKCSFLTSTTVARAKGIIARIFHANPRKISLTAECGSERFRLELDNPLRSIDFYSLADGDTVIVTVSE
uniref:Ubiquitin-like domain-containing protein n=1 Tax=Toxocara canis TaxID=6265 RepID=A0A183U0L6_TOXCA